MESSEQLVKPIVTAPPMMPAAISVFNVCPEVPGALDSIWALVLAELERAVALERGSYTVEHVYDWVCSGEHQLWVVSRSRRVIAVLLTRILPCPTGKRILELYLGAGQDVRQWYRRALEVIESFGRLHGVTELRVTGRKGWQRYLAPYGYKPAAIILRKEA